MITVLFKSVVAFAALSVVSLDLPKGWGRGGTDVTQYEVGLDPKAGQHGSAAATIRSLVEKPEMFGVMLQYVAPDKYLKKRIRMTGFMKSKDVSEWAGFWLRVDQANSNDPLSFDNMNDRPIKGTTDWTKYEIVLDVPENAINIAFGALMNGTGQIWFDNLKFEIVDAAVPVTGNFNRPRGALSEPANLDFENR